MVRLTFEGTAQDLPEGASLVALLDPARPGATRGPLCGMGVCQECLVQLGNRPVLACRTLALPDMEVRRA